MRKALTGYASLTMPMGQVKECATFTCAHCSAIRHVKPYCDPADLGGFCRCCAGVICEQCVGKDCDPIIRQIERQEKAALSRRWMDECA